MSRLLIAASGTGGHLFPALAVAEALPKSWNISWLGVPDRLEVRLIPKKYNLFTIKAGGLQRNVIHKSLRILQLLYGCIKVRQLIKSQQIDAVFTTGGYISAPAIIGARISGIPVLLHESNVIPGKVTRLLGIFCQKIAIGLSDTAQQIPYLQTTLTGTPVRQEFQSYQRLPKWIPPGDGPLVIILGGSQGAVGLNRMVRDFLPSILELGCRVVHITGKNDPERNQVFHPNLIEKEFTTEVAALLQHADIAISRAGAGSLSELAVCGTPTIFIPFPNASDNHQEANALCAASIGAAVIVHQHSPEMNTLRDTLYRLLKLDLIEQNKSNQPLLLMRNQMKTLAILDAEKRLVKLIRQLKK